jgi:hypothetical protein
MQYPTFNPPLLFLSFSLADLRVQIEITEKCRHKMVHFCPAVFFFASPFALWSLLIRLSRYASGLPW